MELYCRISNYGRTAILEAVDAKTGKVTDIAVGQWIKDLRNGYYLVKEDKDKMRLFYYMKTIKKIVCVLKNFEDAALVGRYFLFKRGFFWFVKREDGKHLLLGEELRFFYADLDVRGISVCYLDGANQWQRRRYLTHNTFVNGYALFLREDGFYDVMRIKDKVLWEVKRKEVWLRELCEYWIGYVWDETAQGYAKAREGFDLVAKLTFSERVRLWMSEWLPFFKRQLV